MSILIFRIICLISVLSCLYGFSAAAPISAEGTVRTFSLSSSVDHNTTPRGAVLRVGESGALRRGAASKLRYSVAGEVDGSDTVLQPRGWVEDGSEFETIERRGIKEFFQNLGNKIKSGFQKVGEAFHTVGNKIKEGFQTAGRKIKEGFQTAGTKIKEGFQTAGRKMKEGFQTAGRKIKEGFQVAGAKMKEGFQKAGKWIKETGAKVAKFGLKVVATISAVASHVAKFIPIIGQPLSAALKVHSFAMNKASDAIHADLGSKLNKGMHVMDIIQDPLGYAVKKGAQQVMNHVQNRPRPNGAHAGPQFVPHGRPQIKASPSRSGGRGKAGIATAVLRTAASAAQHRFAASRSSSRSPSRSPSRSLSRATSRVQSQHFSASRSAAAHPAPRVQQHFSAARSAARSAVRSAARTVQRHVQAVHRTSNRPAPAHKSGPPPRHSAPAPHPAQRHNNPAPAPRRNTPPPPRRNNPPPPAPKRGKGKGR